MAVIEVKQLCKKFNQQAAVNNVSFTIEQGHCFGLLGPNGAGKTTTIEMLEGILQPTSGVINYFGQPISRTIYQQVGIQFQNTALPDYLSVRETIGLFASFYQHHASLQQLFELCQLESFIDQDTRSLSGGQRQRMLLALALVNDPAIVYLDEPSTGLDPQARQHFWDLIREIKRQGKTIILTTHYMEEAQVLCDDIVIMDQGVIIEQGAPDELLQRHFNGVYIQIPDVNFQSWPDDRPELKASRRSGYRELLCQEVEHTLGELIALGVGLQGMQIKVPNLEDLFLKLTGRELRT